MAFSTCILHGQSPACCQFCEVDPKIQWKCIDCDLLLCTKCKDKIHSKVKTTEEHKIINIKEIGKPSDSDTIQPIREGPVEMAPAHDYDKVQQVNKDPVSLQLSIVQECTTEFPIDFIQVSEVDDSLWIGSTDNTKVGFFSFKSYGHLQKVKLKSNNLKKISSFNVDVRDIAVTPSNDLILTDGTSQLKQILYNSNKLTESIYCVKPYQAVCVHVTRNNKIVVGVLGAVFVMDINGVCQQIYSRDNNQKLLFKRPQRITSTSTATLCVIDTRKERLVMLGPGKIIGVYTGHPDINSDKKPFTPRDVVSTVYANIVVLDSLNETLHILNNTGNFLTYYHTQEIGIPYPWSLAFNMASSILYIGCHLRDKGKLYKLTLSGW